MDAKMDQSPKQPSKKQFKQLTDQELTNKRRSLENNNTVNAEKCADKAFKQFLEECGAESTEYYFFEEDELSQWLSKFWFGVRMMPEDNEEEEKFYSVSTLRSFKYAINRILKKHGHAFDITKSPFFKPCMDSFNDAIKELKEAGRGHVKVKEEISEEGISCLFLANLCTHLTRLT